jgi:uncharacterized protein
MKNLFFGILVMLTLAVSTISLAASFDCTKASSITEKAICSSKRISLLDNFMAISYKTQLSNSSKEEKIKITDEQKKWNRNTRDGCGDSLQCLEKSYQERLEGILQFENFDEYLKKQNWKHTKYSPGKQWCTHEYGKGSENIKVVVYCAGDAFSSLNYP